MAYIDKEAVGAVGYNFRRGRLTFGPLGVVPKYQRSGVGSAIIDWIESRARKRKCSEVRGFVLRGLSSLVRFYNRNGYSTHRSRNGLIIAKKRF